jgi:hypothetical protein
VHEILPEKLVLAKEYVEQASLRGDILLICTTIRHVAS